MEKVKCFEYNSTKFMTFFQYKKDLELNFIGKNFKRDFLGIRVSLNRPVCDATDELCTLHKNTMYVH